MLSVLAKALLVWCVLVQKSEQFSRKSSDSYVAGVVEYKPSTNMDPFKRAELNLAEYLKFINSAQEQNVDIIVFPESTLNSVPHNRSVAAETTTEVPEPKENIIPCNRLNLDRNNAYNEILVPLSCAAKSSKLYVVVNLSEQAKCNKETQAGANDTRPCARDGLNFYNTDVVFDRTGAVVARYRKYNLFGERNMNTTKLPEHSTFLTDFGVRFGLFTCFDIMFNEPALAMVREGVRDFIFPTMWFSELPFLTALQIQEYWSFTNNVNLLASGASNTMIGSGGSGIYAGTKGPLVKYISIPGQNNNKLLVATVPKHGNSIEKIEDGKFEERYEEFTYEEEPNMDAFYMKRDEIDKFTSEVIGEHFSKELCNGNLCCTFDVSTKILNRTAGKESYQYRAIVGDIQRSFSGVANGGVKACAIIACSGSDFKHCAKRFPTSRNVEPRQIFNKISIRGDFPAIDEVLTMPDTLTHFMAPLKTDSFLYDESLKEQHMKTVSMQLANGNEIDNLQTFAIYGRDFRGDGKVKEEDMTYFQYNVVQMDITL